MQICRGDRVRPLISRQDGSRNRAMWLSDLSADFVPDFLHGLVALVREHRNARAIGLRDFQAEPRENQRPISPRQVIKFDHGRTPERWSMAYPHARLADTMSDCDNPIPAALSSH